MLMRLCLIAGSAGLIAYTSAGAAAPIEVTSPGGVATVTLALQDGEPTWAVRFRGECVLRSAPLGLVPADTPFRGGFEPLESGQSVVDSTWKPVWGKFASVRNHYRRLTWKLRERGRRRRTLEVIVRAYDDGVAVRYRISGVKDRTVADDNTHFAFEGDPICWGANFEHPSIGPVTLSKYPGRQFPITVRTAPDCYCSILEAAIYDHAPMVPKRVDAATLRASFQRSVLNGSGLTSWRVLVLGRTPGELLTSTIMVNLNPPCALKETGWIKPGLALWDWRAWGGKADDGFVYGLDMPSWKRQIDFASKNNISYLILDAGWYGLEFDKRSDPTTSRTFLLEQKDPNNPKLTPKAPPKDWKDPIDIPALIRYARERNVEIFLYINDIARHNFDFENTLKTYHRWGAAGIKYGFMRGKGQEKVRTTRRIVRMCAENRLMCDFHDSPVPPSGDRRTFPNYVTREFCHSQADATRSFSPSTFCTTIFCNMVAGPLDMCNGFFTLDGVERVRPKVFSPINSTVVAESARVLIVFSGLAVLPDTPEAYAGKSDLFEFIRRLPMTWDDTRVLNAEIGRSVTTARRSGNDWFVGSCCNEKGAVLEIPLDFLDSGKVYTATLYEDAPESHFMKNKESYRIRKRTVRRGDIITARLAPGGGHCVYLTPK